jgi:transcriptional regulator with XRE-family HTH domain
MIDARTLKMRRMAAGLTQDDLATKSGVSVRTIAYLESGDSPEPHKGTVLLLCHALKCQPEQLTGVDTSHDDA